MNKATIKDQVHHLTRRDPRTGFSESMVFTGSLSDKPRGWKLKPMVAENGSRASGQPGYGCGSVV